jgi:hypothetical protein
MLVSLLAFGAAPAGAAIDTSDSCPSSIADAGFTDLAGVPAAAVGAINCVAAYGISTGTSATTFDPFADVARWQMALFITRQVTAHGLGSALPATPATPFTDLGGVPAAAVTSINQIAALGISTGTSATTFDPFATVERWQMALFLQRLITIAVGDNTPAVTLPTGTDQGFTDLAGVPAAGVTAINVIAELDVADGTSATTFDPFAAVQRWAMALFLARTLAADGITPPPPALGTFIITPGGTQTVDPDGSIVMTLTNPIAGAVHSMGLYPSGNVDGDVFDDDPNNNIADDLGTTNAEIVKVNGVATGGVQYSEAAPANGQITVEIEGIADFSTVVLVIWADDGDNELDLKSNDTPAETYGVSGSIQLLPAEAPNGADSSYDVIFVDTDANYVVGDDGADVYTFFYGKTGDVFHYDDDFLITLAQFESFVSIGDEFDFYDFPYSQTAGSDFDLYSDMPNAPTGVTTAVGDYDTDAGTTAKDDVKVTWTAATGGNLAETSSAEYVAELYEDDAVSTNDCEDGVFVDSVTVDGNKLTATFVDVADDVYCAVVYATSWTNDDSDYSDSALATVAVGETNPPLITDLDLTTDTVTVGFLDSGDVVTFGFSEAMAATLDDGNATFFRVSDGDSVYQIACADQATCALGDGPTSTDANDQMVVTLTAAPVFVSGTDNGVDLTATPTVTFVSAAWDDAGGNQLNLTGSTDKTIN